MNKTEKEWDNIVREDIKAQIFKKIEERERIQHELDILANILTRLCGYDEGEE